MSRVSSLFRLQEVDSELDRKQERIDEINVLLSDDSELTSARDKRNLADEEFKEARAAYSSANHAVVAQRDKIADTERKLYGGSVTNPKELEDLQLESESLKKYLVTLEDRYLEAMLQQDESEENYISARDAYDLLEAQQLSEHADLDEERTNLSTDIENKEQEREVLVGDIETEDLEQYERLRARLNGIAVAEVREGSCSACGLDQVRSKVQEIRTGNVIIQCAQCNRILYTG